MRIIRAHRALLISAATLLSATACSGGDQPATSVQLNAFSDSGTAKVSYTIDGDLRFETVETPWERVVELSDSFEIEFTVTNLVQRGTVECEIQIPPRGPRAQGEAAAECSLSGSSSGGTLSTTSFAEGIDRETKPPSTEAAEEATDEAAEIELTGIDARVVIVGEDGSPATLTQFESVRFVLEVTGINTSGTFQVRSNSEYDNGDKVATLKKVTRYEPSDLVSGVFTRVMASTTLDEVGVHTFSFEGFVLLDDSGARARFSDEVEFTIE